MLIGSALLSISAFHVVACEVDKNILKIESFSFNTKGQQLANSNTVFQSSKHLTLRQVELNADKTLALIRVEDEEHIQYAAIYDLAQNKVSEPLFLSKRTSSCIWKSRRSFLFRSIANPQGLMRVDFDMSMKFNKHRVKDTELPVTRNIADPQLYAALKASRIFDAPTLHGPLNFSDSYFGKAKGLGIYDNDSKTIVVYGASPTTIENIGTYVLQRNQDQWSKTFLPSESRPIYVLGGKLLFINMSHSKSRIAMLYNLEQGTRSIAAFKGLCDAG